MRTASAQPASTAAHSAARPARSPLPRLRRPGGCVAATVGPWKLNLNFACGGKASAGWVIFRI
jgi:hypothetical protein